MSGAKFSMKSPFRSRILNVLEMTDTTLISTVITLCFTPQP
jgi:hypothetical protein